MTFRVAGDLEDLRKATTGEDMVDAYILLAGGLARSSKTIKHQWRADGKSWCINNEIDGSHQDLSDAELWTESNIGEALDKYALMIDA